MDALSVLLALYAERQLITGGYPSQFASKTLLDDFLKTVERLAKLPFFSDALVPRPRYIITDTSHYPSVVVLWLWVFLLIVDYSTISC